MVISVLDKKHRLNVLDKQSLAGTIVMLVNPLAIINVGFCMSYFVSIAISYVGLLKIKSKLTETVLINFVGSVCSAPFVCLISGEVSVLVVLTSLLLFTVFMFVWLYSLLFFWAYFLVDVH